MSVYKVITPVGTSLITNAVEKKEVRKEDKERLEDKRANEYDDYQERIGILKRNLQQFVQQAQQNASAEIASLLKIKGQYPDNELDVYLLASDTILSVLCAEMIKEYLEKNENRMRVYFNKQKDVINDLQVSNGLAFRNGLRCLFQKLNNIKENCYSQYTSINITGGYKVSIPYLTLFANLHSLKTYYLFEDSESLLEITPIPIDYDRSFFQRYSQVLNQIYNGVPQQQFNRIMNQICYEDKERVQDMTELERIDNNQTVFLRGEYDLILKHINDFLIVEVPYRASIDKYVRRLWNGLKDLLNNNPNGADIFSLIRQNADPFCHTTINSAFVYKVPQAEPEVRLLYSLEATGRDVTKIVVYDYNEGNFIHSRRDAVRRNTYLEEWENNCATLVENKRNTITIRR